MILKCITDSNADAVSRLSHLEPPTKEEEEEEAGYIHRLYEFVKKLEADDKMIRSLHRNSDKLTRDNLVREHKDDQTLEQVRRWIKEKNYHLNKRLKINLKNSKSIIKTLRH